MSAVGRGGEGAQLPCGTCRLPTKRGASAMSDQPLFQNQEEQERVYAPQELPRGNADEREAEVEEGSAQADVGSNAAIGAPGAAAPAMVGGAASGSLGMSGGGGVTPGVAPAIGAAALSDADDEERNRDR